MTEERLKKRAEEYAKKIEKELLEDYKPREYGTTPYLATIPTPYNRQAFIDGYHECEKEHEWHYDGTPDTTHKSCLVYCEKLPHIRIAYWNGQDWVENTIIRFPEVKAWRYADYPKEIE
jgi:hypothetical protein